MRTARRRLALVVSAFAVVALITGGFAVANAVESPSPGLTQLDGQLMMAHGDNFAGGAMVMQASLRTKSGNVRINLPKSRHGLALALAGRHVRVRGTRVAGSEAFNVASLAPADSASPAAAPRTMNIAVVLMHLHGSTTGGVSTSTAQNTFFGATGSVAAWMNEVSGGQIAVTGTVFGYYDNGPASCDLSKWQNAGATAAAKDGYSTSKYNYIVVYSPGQSCGFSGVGWVGASGVYLNGAMSTGVAVHELGHNLGVWHAGQYQCSGALSDSCLVDYGDPNDVMGGASLLRHYNAVHLQMMGLLPSSEVQTVTSGTQTISLTAEEKPLVNGATELIYVSRPDGSRWAVERRMSAGFDSGLSGVWIRLVSRENTDDTELLSGNALAAGQTFHDPSNNISIKTVSDSGPTASVQVCVGACGSGGGSTTTTSSTSSTTSTSTSTSSTTTTTLPPGGSTVSVYVHRGRVIVNGTSGNDVIHLVGLPNGVREVDANGAPVSVGHGCTLSGTTATCRGGSFYALLGDGDDEVYVSGTARSVLDGGNGNDWFVGGPHMDKFIGGPGYDTVDYSGRPKDSVRAYIGGGAKSGAPGERDTISADIESVVLP